MKNKYQALCHLSRFNAGNNTKLFEADTQWEAVVAARLHFKLKPKEVSMLTVMIVEKNGKEITHTPTF